MRPISILSLVHFSSRQSDAPKHLAKFICAIFILLEIIIGLILDSLITVVSFVNVCLN